jgi:two-component system sensor histidine kinase YcbA
LGPIGLGFVALLFPFQPAYLTGAAAGLMVPLVHMVIARLTTPAASLFLTIDSYGPETVAYALLGLLLYQFRVHTRTHTPFYLVFALAAADLLTNVAEILLRHEPHLVHDIVIAAMVAIGRAIVLVGAFYVVQEGERERQWERERQSYLQRLFLVVNLQTEAFFLQKSASEIEQVMAKAHRLYRDLAGFAEQPMALEIAKDIHEVKKDTQRTLATLFRLVDAPELAREMTFGQIVTLVFDANVTYAATLTKQIILSQEIGADFCTARFGRWVSILNNLVSNAIEACEARGTVLIHSSRMGNQFILEVINSGPGIPPEDWEVIFSAGFSTKLHPRTGAFSSGIGLTHVVGLVRAMGGTIRVAASQPGRTVFRMEIPWVALEPVSEGG